MYEPTQIGSLNNIIFGIGSNLEWNRINYRYTYKRYFSFLPSRL